MNWLEIEKIAALLHVALGRHIEDAQDNFEYLCNTTHMSESEIELHDRWMVATENARAAVWKLLGTDEDYRADLIANARDEYAKR